ncbi:hypothetical protein CH249_15390 [Rhodococcus sp. 05-2255-3B1]|nr:hypothetical protein CH250_23455 [Rhodococcus sp. 05-2255-3C]OZE09563.1 hypothetical protein CH249_15390 [Rhodococcus sp. 05-2255-3B1]OZE14829.1 hypothetical protein CH255_21735 [Rhodococcus sp. 05-2255-2A2]
MWKTGTIQTITRWALRLLVVYVVVGMACAAALLVHVLPRTVQLMVNTVSFSWWTTQLVMFVGCAATGQGARCSRRPRLLQVHPTTPWFNTTNLQTLWTRTAWMV